MKVDDKMKNNKGFTLVELLAVIVILVAIISIAIPSITSSVERTKDKEYNAKVDLIKAAAEVYVSNHKNAIPTSGICYINVTQLISDGVVSAKNIADPRSTNNQAINGYVVYNASDKSYGFGTVSGTLCIPE